MIPGIGGPASAGFSAYSLQSLRRSPTRRSTCVASQLRSEGIGGWGFGREDRVDDSYSVTVGHPRFGKISAGMEFLPGPNSEHVDV